MDFEFSSNIDLRDIPPFWKKIGELIDGGISEDEIKHIRKFAYGVQNNSEDAIKMSFKFLSCKCELAFAIKIDDHTPSLLMLSDSSSLIDAISAKYQELCIELGK